VVSTQHETIDELRPARLQHADVAARSTDLHRDEVVGAAKPAVILHGTDTCGRSRKTQPDRRLGNPAERNCATVALDQGNFTAEAEFAQPEAQGLQI
jgi:hypothetical protein